MSESLMMHGGSVVAVTPPGVWLHRAFHRMRGAMLPRRWVIPWEMRENSRFYAKALSEARARKASRDDILSLEAEAAHFYWELEEELEMLESDRLHKQATRYLLPTPPLPRNLNDPDGDPNWRRGTTFKPDLYLTRKAMQELRSTIRTERKSRLEPASERVKLLGAIIGGAGGAVILVEKLLGWIG